ncbi:MAG: hypothetical protein HYR50_00235 [Candidatus Rokubacteria bacterium]|nr:hypothetical protein [Candidatus Rokubacteria bacterium]
MTYEVEGKHHFWGGLTVEAVGGGAGLVEMLLERAAKVGIDVRYEHGVRSLLTDSVTAPREEARTRPHAR